MSASPFPRVITPETQPFWEAVDQERLLIPRCGGCSSYFFPPAPVCPYCGSRDVHWREASGRATLYSFVITENPWPAWDTNGPMSVAMVELEEGPRMVSTVVDCEQSPEALRIDMPLRASWRSFDDGVKLLCFKPDHSSELS